MAPTAQTNNSYLQHSFLAESLDPIHIGTGEFQLGRVDNTIVREAGTNLPKLPGSSLAGVTRAYAAMHFDRYRWPVDGVEDGKQWMCAGKGGGRGEKHCGLPDCPVCTTFGFSIDGASFQGLAQFSDARILFFPVYSMAEPLWITCPGALLAADCKATGEEWHAWNNRLKPGDGDAVLPLGRKLPNPINLGWLYLPHFSGSERPPATTEWTLPLCGQSAALSSVPWLAPVLDRLVLVSDARFSNIVEDQLEVRTSVSISPETGAAEEGALFTAEAIPRATFFVFKVTCLQPAYFRVPPRNGKGEASPIKYQDKDATLQDVMRNVQAGLGMIEYLGLGGVNTRGMGRLRVVMKGDSQ